MSNAATALGATAPEPVVQQARKTLLTAFVFQVFIIVLCVGASIGLYIDYKHKLSQQLTYQRQLELQLNAQELQLKDDKVSLANAQRDMGTALTIQVQQAIESKKYSNAIPYAYDGLKAFPKDPIFTWLLAKSLILNGEGPEALKIASTLPLTTDSATKDAVQRNLLTLGIAKCSQHDDPGAVAAIQQAGIARFNTTDIEKFCSPAVRSKVLP